MFSFAFQTWMFLKKNHLWWEILAKECLFLGFAFNMSFLAKQITFHQTWGHRVYPTMYSDCICKCKADAMWELFQMEGWTVASWCEISRPTLTTGTPVCKRYLFQTLRVKERGIVDSLQKRIKKLRAKGPLGSGNHRVSDWPAARIRLCPIKVTKKNTVSHLAEISSRCATLGKRRL